MSLNAVTSLALLVGLVLAGAIHLLALAGHFPLEHRKPDLAGTGGSRILWTTLAVVLTALALGIWAATRHVGWAVAIIAGGAGALCAPLLLAQLPDRVVDGRLGLIGPSVLSATLALLAWFRS